MKLFKNDVGRPSNETKRKVFVLVIIFIVLCVLGGASYYLIHTFKKNTADSDGKNAAVGFGNYVGKQYYVDLSYMNSNYSMLYYACPNGYKLTADLRCTSNKTKKYTVSYNNEKDKFTKASQLCKQYGFTSAKNVIFYKALKKLSFTCYNDKRIDASGFYVPYYNQNRDVKNNVKSACGDGNKTLNSGGCLPSSISIALGALGAGYNPTDVNNIVKKLIYSGYRRNFCGYGTCYSGGFRICEDGSYYAEVVNKLANDKGLVADSFSNASEIDKLLKTGKCTGIAALNSGCGGRYCYNVKHFVAVLPSDKTGKVYVSDPANVANELVLESTSTVLRSTQSGYIKLICKNGFSNVF